MSEGTIWKFMLVWRKGLYLCVCVITGRENQMDTEEILDLLIEEKVCDIDEINVNQSAELKRILEENREVF